MTSRTIQNAEAGKGMSRSVMEQVIKAFAQGGVEFLPGNGVRQKEATFEAHDGEAGIMALLDDVYETVAAAKNKTILIANNAEPISYSKELADYLHMHLKRLQAIGASEKIIACEGDEDLMAGIATYRCVARDDFIDAPTLIYGGKIALLRWGPPAKVVIVDEPIMAESLRRLFSHAWKHARTPEGVL